MVTIIKNELPTRFQSYCEMFAYMEDRILLDTTQINYAEQGINTVWEFTVDFIKARCFDEIKNWYPIEYKTDYAGHDWMWERLELIKKFQIKSKLGIERVNEI